MGTIRVDVDVDEVLCEIDTDDLLKELKDRDRDIIECGMIRQRRMKLQEYLIERYHLRGCPTNEQILEKVKEELTT